MVEKKMPTRCPICGGELHIAKLSCKDCGSEIICDFALDNSINTSEEEFDFIKLFLKYEGNISKIQKELSIGYSEVKKRLNQINKKLGNEVNEMDTSVLNMINESNSDSRVVARLKEKMRECGGKSRMEMLRGEPITIYLSNDGKGIIADSFKSLVMEWRIFDAIIEKANSLGGKMTRGDAMAQKGAKIGTSSFPVDTIDAFISMKFYGSQIGDTALRRSTYYSGVLAWAGIVENNRSEGEGGYIKVNATYKN